MSRRVKVLLVEDSPDQVAVLRVFLRQAPCDLELASDGRAALDAFERETFDLVLLDMYLPVLNGFEVAGRIRELERAASRPACRIVAITAADSENERRRPLDAGCNEVLPKPVDRHALLRLVEEVQAKVLP